MQPQLGRKEVMICLRDDKEAVLSETQKKRIFEIFREREEVIIISSMHRNGRNRFDRTRKGGWKK
jgi:hypothetical protein